MKMLLIILFTALNTYVFSENLVDQAFKTIEKFNPNSEGLDFQIQFTMRAKGIIKGDLSYCLASLVNIKSTKYLVTSTGCLVRKGTKIKSNTYYATGYKIIYQDHKITGPISFNHNNIPENSILLIKLPPNYQDNSTNIPINPLLIIANHLDYDTINNKFVSFKKLFIPKQDLIDGFSKLLFSQYYSRNTDKTLKTSPVLISIPNRVGEQYNLSSDFLFYSLDNNNFYIGMTTPSDLYIKTSQGVTLNNAVEIFKFHNNSVIRSLGASLSYYSNNNWELIGILTGNKESKPYFSFFSAETIYLLDNANKTLIATDLLNIN